MLGLHTPPKHKSRWSLKTPYERFWDNVDKNGALWTDPATGEQSHCWKWKSKGNHQGYGSLLVHDKRHLAHRISWELHHGEIPSDLFVLHKCDNPSCTNPAHLFLGTRQENNADRHRKGRSGSHKGTNNGAAKLTWEQVRTIRREYDGTQTREFVEKYGVSTSAIGHIVYNLSWKE